MSCLIECMIDWRLSTEHSPSPSWDSQWTIDKSSRESLLFPLLLSLTEGTTELQNGRLIWGNHKPNWTYEQLGQLFRWAVVPADAAVATTVVVVVAVVAITIDPLGSFIVSDSIAKGSINMAAGPNVLNPLRANGANCWMLATNVPYMTRWGLQIRP